MDLGTTDYREKGAIDEEETESDVGECITSTSDFPNSPVDPFLSGCIDFPELHRAFEVTSNSSKDLFCVCVVWILL